MFKILIYSIFIFPGFLFSQNLGTLYNFIEKGDLETVRKLIPGLQKKYPNEVSVLYLSAIVEDDGEKALLIYKDVLSQFPNSSYADNALMKIIEYLYIKGLYQKTIKYSRTLTRKYPASEVLGDCVNLMLCSYSVMNKRDSVDYYYGYFLEMYPDLQLQFNDYKYSSQFVVEKYNKEVKKETSNQFQKPENKPKTPVKVFPAKPRFSIQVGAYGTTTNAYFLKNKLEAKGYDVFIEKIRPRKKTLLAVRVGSFSNKDEATKFAKEFKRKEKLNYIVVEN